MALKTREELLSQFLNDAPEEPVPPQKLSDGTNVKETLDPPRIWTTAKDGTVTVKFASESDD